MEAVLHPTATHTLPFVWFPVVLAGVAAGLALILGRRSLLRWTARLRRPATDATSAVNEMVAAAVADADEDSLVMRAAYELTRLLDLRDCRWATDGPSSSDDGPAALLHDDASITFGAFRWRTEVHGLPLRGVERPLAARGRWFGSLVLVPRTSDPVSNVELRAAVAVSDVLALGLDDSGAWIVPTSDSQP